MLVRNGANISIGPYRFIFEFNVEDEESFQQAKADYLATYSGGHPHESTSITPSVDDVHVGDWVPHGIVGASRASVIHAASHAKSGETTAVKRVRVNTPGDNELTLYEAISADVRGHRYSKFVMQKHGELANSRPYMSEREVYILWKPLARADLTQFGLSGRWCTAGELVKLTLFVQALLGLSALHDCGWIHRDLKPANLGVVDIEKSQFAVIMDLGQATRQSPLGHTPNPGHTGTIGYLAPELESQATVRAYDEKVDIWSMGAVAFVLFVGKVPWSVKSNMFVPERSAKDPAIDEFRSCRARLLSRPKNSLEYLIAMMMEEDPRKRPGISDVLAHPSIQETRMEIDDELHAADRVTGQKRSRTT